MSEMIKVGPKDYTLGHTEFISHIILSNKELAAFMQYVLMADLITFYSHLLLGLVINAYPSIA